MVNYGQDCLNEDLYMVPILSGTFLIALCILAYALVKHQKLSSWTPHILFYGIGFQIMTALFMLGSTEWMMSLQFVAIGSFGIWTTYRVRSFDYTIYGFMSLFNFFAVIGKFSVLNYTLSLWATFGWESDTSFFTNPCSTSSSVCVGYFGLDCACNPLCSQYVNFLRILSFLMIFNCVIQAFFSFYLSETPKVLRKEGICYYLTQVSEAVNNIENKNPDRSPERERLTDSQ